MMNSKSIATRSPLLPQSPGPHLNEIKFVVEPIETVIAAKRVFHLRYHYEVEYYMHPESPFASGESRDEQDQNNSVTGQNTAAGTSGLPFPVKVDYLKLKADDNEQTFDQDDWDSNNLKKLACKTLPSAVPHPEAGPYQVVRSPSYLLTEDEDGVGSEAPIVFDPLENSQVKFQVNLRLGIGSLVGAGVKQMVPLGTEPDDTLEAEFSIDLSFPDPRILCQLGGRRPTRQLAQR